MPPWLSLSSSLRPQLLSVAYSTSHPKFSVSCAPPSLPDILRKFNGNLTGYAVGTGDANETNAFLNQAVPGAKAEYAVGGGELLGREWEAHHSL